MAIPHVNAVNFEASTIPCRKKYQMARNMVDYKDSPYESNDQYGVGNSSNLADTLRILKEEIRIRKEDTDRITQTQEKHAEVNAVIL